MNTYLLSSSWPNPRLCYWWLVLGLCYFVFLDKVIIKPSLPLTFCLCRSPSVLLHSVWEAEWGEKKRLHPDGSVAKCLGQSQVGSPVLGVCEWQWHSRELEWRAGRVLWKRLMDGSTHGYIHCVVYRYGKRANITLSKMRVQRVDFFYNLQKQFT